MQDIELFGILTAYVDSFGFRCFCGQAETQITERGFIRVHRDKIVFSPCNDEMPSPTQNRSTVILSHSARAIHLLDEIAKFGEYTVTVFGNQDDRAELCSLRAIDRDSASRFRRIMTMFLCDNGYIKTQNSIYLAPDKPVPKKRKFYRNII